MMPPVLSDGSDAGDDVALGARMKGYENALKTTLDPTSPFMVRLDGCSFSKFTTGLRKPFDDQFASVMTAVAADLLEKFHARTAYTQSDEISLLFYPIETEGSAHIYGGRIDKIVSVMAAFATARFVFHLMQRDWSAYSPVVQAKMMSGKVAFDGRAFSLDETEMANCVIWRSRDCGRNTTSNYAFCAFGHRAIHGWNVNKMREELKKAGTNWERDVPDRARFGLFLKNAQVIMPMVAPHGPQAGQVVQAQRTRVVTRSFLITRATPENIALLKAKYAPDWL